MRPHLSSNTSTQKLPVLVWIYGGGFTGGSSADPQYNLSGIVQTASASGTPIIGVSINYRLGVWGFLQTPQVLAEGSANAGLLDQRMAFRWIRENIDAFNGDPRRITIWGESAGAQSIGLHLHSFNGRDDGLYHAAILESGGPIGTALQSLGFYAAPTQNLSMAVGCEEASDQLVCLRNVTSADLYAAQQTTVWNPMVDGHFLTAYPSQLMANSTFVHVPLLIGANSDEGTSFGIKNVDNATAIFNGLLGYRAYSISPPSIDQLLGLYPNDPSHEPPYDIANDTLFPANGQQWRRSAAICGDIVMIGQRRKVCEEYNKCGNDVYSYRFAQRPYVGTQANGVGHFVNVAFSFQNISGALGPVPLYADNLRLSNAIGRAYANFATFHNPNGHDLTKRAADNLPYWPGWTCSAPQNMVLLGNGSWVEPDTFRQAGINFLNSIDREFLA